MSYKDEQDLDLLNRKRHILEYNVTITKSPEECWLWNKNVGENGYGVVTLGKDKSGRQRTINAHRLCYLLFIGPIPEGMSCLHICDNRRCCNPSHLFLGTQQDNIKDMIKKGRARFSSMQGKTHSEETKKKISESAKKAWGTL